MPESRDARRGRDAREDHQRKRGTARELQGMGKVPTPESAQGYRRPAPQRLTACPTDGRPRFPVSGRSFQVGTTDRKPAGCRSPRACRWRARGFQRLFRPMFSSSGEDTLMPGCRFLKLSEGRGPGVRGRSAGWEGYGLPRPRTGLGVRDGVAGPGRAATGRRGGGSSGRPGARGSAWCRAARYGRATQTGKRPGSRPWPHRWPGPVCWTGP